MLLADRIPALSSHLSRIYPDRVEEVISILEAEFSDLASSEATSSRKDKWSERDIVLITYADQIRPSNEHDNSPLIALKSWLLENQLDGLLNTVHLLPFCPYSSDDGFSVIDYLQVDPESGDWQDIASLGESFDLMYDLVLNHISQYSEWYQAYLRDQEPYNKFFIEADPDLDYSLVVRPRSLPLLTPAEVNGETRHVWTTFSADQIDLNYEEPLVLARMLRILVEYALRGARIIRLDAVAFLWKRLGTNCLHLSETHQIVKLMRDTLEAFAPQTLVLTETNVPHAENVSYFGGNEQGEGDEAHMVYQFSLPPLLLDAFMSGDGTAICNWLANLAPPPKGCTFFNFTASHDGVGVRPLEGLVPYERIHELATAVQARGGRINTRRKPDGSDSPYELCTTYFEAMAPTEPNHELHIQRFMSSQAVMLALQGMPAIYFHSLVASPNDTVGADESGIHRRLNRKKYTKSELDTILKQEDSTQRAVFDRYRQMIDIRIKQPAFHPNASQKVVPQDSPNLLAFEREAFEGDQKILVAVNFSESVSDLARPEAYRGAMKDIIGDIAYPAGETLTLEAGAVVWLTM